MQPEHVRRAVLVHVKRGGQGHRREGVAKVRALIQGGESAAGQVAVVVFPEGDDRRIDVVRRRRADGR